MFIWSLWVLLFANPNHADWITDNPELYFYVMPNDAAVNKLGETFIVHKKEAQIFKIDADGALQEPFGRRGKGPGEMMYPSGISVEGNRVYIFDHIIRRLIVFDAGGAFVEDHTLTKPYFKVSKCTDGWLTLENHYSGALAGQSDLHWHKTLKGEPILLGQTTANGKDQTSQRSEKVFRTTYNPAKDRIHFGTMQNGGKVVVIHPGSKLKITIHDSKTGDVKASLMGDNEPVPFNKNWGESTFERVQESRKKSGRSSPIKTELVSEFPDFFPFARRVWIFEDGHFYILPWSSDPNQQKELLGFDMQARPIEHALTSRMLHHVIHMTHSHAWFVFYDSDAEESKVAKVPRNQMAEFHEKMFPKAKPEQTTKRK